MQGEDISSLKNVLCGVPPLSVKLFHDFEELTGIKILEGYGFTSVNEENRAKLSAAINDLLGGYTVKYELV